MLAAMEPTQQVSRMILDVTKENATDKRYIPRLHNRQVKDLVDNFFEQFGAHMKLDE